MLCLSKIYGYFYLQNPSSPISFSLVFYKSSDFVNLKTCHYWWFNSKSAICRDSVRIIIPRRMTQKSYKENLRKILILLKNVTLVRILILDNLYVSKNSKNSNRKDWNAISKTMIAWKFKLQQSTFRHEYKDAKLTTS